MEQIPWSWFCVLSFCLHLLDFERKRLQVLTFNSYKITLPVLYSSFSDFMYIFVPLLVFIVLPDASTLKFKHCILH